MEKKTILITGGAGFIGSHVNKLLNRAGYSTIVLDNLSHGHSSTVQHGTFIEGDMGDAETVARLFKTYPIHAVMHFAAYIDVGESIRNPAKYYQNNVANTLTFLRVMIQHGVRFCIFSSSAAIFGHPLIERIPEEHPCSPINPYGESKWMVEKILRDFDRAYGLKSCCFRYFNAAGGDPEGRIKNNQQQAQNLIPIILQCVKNKKTFTIFGTDYPTVDGTCIRDYIHIEDLGTAHIQGMERLLTGAPSEAYNLGNGRGYSVREVIQAVESVTGQKVNLIEGARRAGDPPFLIADSSKAIRELNWHPQYSSLEQMIEHAWKAMNVNSCSNSV
jgi:UDP-glucose 4-epimerase